LGPILLKIDGDTGVQISGQKLWPTRYLKFNKNKII
jgi:hypothetical protein